MSRSIKFKLYTYIIYDIFLAYSIIWFIQLFNNFMYNINYTIAPRRTRLTWLFKIYNLMMAAYYKPCYYHKSELNVLRFCRHNISFALQSHAGVVPSNLGAYSHQFRLQKIPFRWWLTHAHIHFLSGIIAAH